MGDTLSKNGGSVSWHSPLCARDGLTCTALHVAKENRGPFKKLLIQPSVLFSDLKKCFVL